MRPATTGLKRISRVLSLGSVTVEAHNNGPQTNIGVFISRPHWAFNEYRGIDLPPPGKGQIGWLKRISADLSPGSAGRPPSKHGTLMNIGCFIPHPTARAGSVRSSEFRGFHLPALLDVPPRKHGPQTNIMGFISPPWQGLARLAEANICGFISRPYWPFGPANTGL